MIWWWKRLDDENDLLIMKTIYLSTLNWIDKEFFLIFLYIASLEQTWQNSSNINSRIELRTLISSIRSNINLRIEFELLFKTRFYDQTNHLNVEINFEILFDFLHERYLSKTTFEFIYLNSKKIIAFIEELNMINFTKRLNELKSSIKHRIKILKWLILINKTKLNEFL
jgi:hypothetical protein